MTSYNNDSSKRHSQYYKIITTLFITFTCFCLSACALNGPDQQLSTNDVADTLQQSVIHNASLLKQNTEVNNALSTALIPKLHLNLSDDQAKNQKFNMVVNNAPIKAFFESLSKDTNQNIVVSPDVTGNVSLDIKHMTLDQVLQAIHTMYGYRIEKTSYGYNVYSKAMQTRVFNVSYLDLQRSGSSETSITSSQITKSSQSSSTEGTTTSSSSNSAQPTSTVKTRSSNNFWNELRVSVAMIIGSTPAPLPPAPATTGTDAEPGTIITPANDTASVMANPQAGLVIVKAYPDQLNRVAKYLREVQNIMHREVMIDAKIVEVNLNAGFQSGVDWSLLGATQTGTTSPTSDLPDFTSIFSLSGKSGSLSASLKLLGTQGRVNVLSSPRITTVNNQKALIKVGDDDYYITGLSSSTTNNAATTTSENVDFTPFFSGVALDVTPEIDAQGDITLHIHPIISKVTSKDTHFTTSSGDGKKQTIPLASSSIRESDNIVRVRNNQIILIGGLIEDRSINQEGGIPGLSKLPGVGGLFKRQNRTSTKSEIVILLQPKLITDQMTQDILQDTAKRYASMNNDYSFNTTVDPHLKS